MFQPPLGVRTTTSKITTTNIIANVTTPDHRQPLQKSFSVRHDAWIVVPFFKAGGRITAGNTHFVEHQETSEDIDAALTPAGETEFAQDKALGYRSSDLVDWIHEKAAAAGGGSAEGGLEQRSPPPAATEHVVSVSLTDLREGGPSAVRKRLVEAQGGCVVVNAIEERDLQVG